MRIVVGVDGSAAALAALRWALAEGRERHAEVEAWHAWHVGQTAAGPPPDEVAAEGAARAVLDAALAGLGEPVKAVLLRAQPASALLDASLRADLLVIGAGSVPRPRLGAVGGQVVPNARCPVVVVPA